MAKITISNITINKMVSIMTSFCCRLYGLRRGQNKAIKLKEILNDKIN